jgi:hypothetical protein
MRLHKEIKSRHQKTKSFHYTKRHQRSRLLGAGLLGNSLRYKTFPCPVTNAPDRGYTSQHSYCSHSNCSDASRFKIGYCSYFKEEVAVGNWQKVYHHNLQTERTINPMSVCKILKRNRLYDSYHCASALPFFLFIWGQRMH